MQRASLGGTRRGWWMECGPRRAVPLMAGGRSLQVVVWRLAVGRPGHGAAVVWPIAVVERRADGRRWWLVPDVSLGFVALGVGLAAWLLLPRDGEPARGTVGRTCRRRGHG